MNLWFHEPQTPDLGFHTRVKKTLHKETTQYQDLMVIDTNQFGRTLVLGEAVQTTIKDEFIYHEMLAHVPLFTHPKPKKVLIIGGGDGGTVREALKHPSIEKIVLVEIDRRVVEVAKEFLPEISCGLDDPKVELVYEDGIAYLQENKEEFDVILVDSPDPVGPAVGLFAEEFYKSIYDSLHPEGLFTAQTESPFFNKDLIRRVYRSIKGIFPIAMLYLAVIPTYPGGLWSFTMGSKDHDPMSLLSQQTNISTKYYTKRLHRSSFILPRFVEELLDDCE